MGTGLSGQRLEADPGFEFISATAVYAITSAHADVDSYFPLQCCV